MTGAEALTHGDIAAAISTVANAPVEYLHLSEEDARQEFSAAGLAPENVERLLNFYRIVRTGAAGAVNPDIERILGRSARSFAEFAAEHASVWSAQ